MEGSEQPCLNVGERLADAAMAASAEGHVRELSAASRLVVELAAGLIVLLIVASVVFQTSPVSLRMQESNN